MDTIVQWATILSPIIAVALAIWASRSSAKETEKKIAALEDSTRKQVESVKELSRLQIDALIKQVELEAGKNLFYAKQAKQEWEGLQNTLNSGMSHMVNVREQIVRDFQEQKPKRDYELYCKFIKEIERFKERVEELKKNIN